MTTGPLAPAKGAPARTQDLSLLVEGPGGVLARVSSMAKAVGLLVGVVGFVGIGVLGGALWSWRAQDADLLFFPLCTVFVAFAFWVYLPQGYLFSDAGFQVLRPRGPLEFPRRRIVGVRGAPALLEALAQKTGCAWLKELPRTDGKPPEAKTIAWIDPELGLPCDESPVELSRAFVLPMPLGGAILIWGAQTGRFWSPAGRIEQRYCRSFRPRLGLWLA